MAYSSKPAAAIAELIPWDHDSPAHRERLYQQRMACGWGAEAVENYGERCVKGSHVFYWLVLKDESPGKNELIAQHTARFPKESSLLQDTAATVWGKPREPPASGRSFMPLGHVALGRLEPDDERARAAAAADDGITAATTSSQSIAWVGPLYVSWAVQRSGLGRFAMDEMERLATLPPLSAGLVALDAVAPEHALMPRLLETAYDAYGRPRPAIANYNWYLKRGYTPYLRKDDMYAWAYSETGEEPRLSTIYLKKETRRV